MAKQILQLADNKSHKLFYAPNAKVEVAGKNLLSHCLEVASVTVEDNLKGMNRFTFVINHAFDLVNREFISLHFPQSDLPMPNGRLDKFFSFGKEVKIYIGYLDKLKLMMTGIITSVRTGFSAGQTPSLTVTGHDKAYKMSRAKRTSLSWSKMKDSDIVSKIAGEHGLGAVVVDTQVENPRVDQDQETDMGFVERLAKRNGYEFYVRDDKLFFCPPRNDEAGKIELEWGVSLLSFTPELNLADQIEKVEVHGWNEDAKAPIVGEAGVNDEPGRDGGRSSGGEFVKKAFGGDATFRIRQPVYSKEEADRVAKSILKNRSESFIKATADSIGLPEIHSDMNIKLNGLGERFSTTYYVEQATHKVDPSGYKTTFKVKDVTI